MCLSGLSLIFIESTIKSTDNLFGFSNSIYSIFAFIGIFLLMKKTRNVLAESGDKRLLAVTVILAMIFSFFMVAGKNILVNNSVQIGQLKTLIKIICGVPLFTAFLILILIKMPEVNQYADKFIQNDASAVSLKKAFVIYWALIFLAWIPSLMASYPGIYGYDSIYQLGYYRSGEISLHHPLAHTYLLGFCIWTMGNFWGDLKKGQLVYSLIQMLFLSGALASICSFLRQKQVAKIYRVIVIGLFMFLPTNAIMSFSATKDILYTVFFAISVLLLIRIASEPDALKIKKIIILLIVVLFLHNIFRSQGIYVALLTLIFGLIAFKGYRKQIAIVFLATVLLFGIYSGPVTNALGGVKLDSIHEMMSIPCMQIARVAEYNSGKFSEKRKHTIANYIPNYKYYPNCEGISDSIKNTFSSTLLRKDPKRFFQLYLQLGHEYPGIYLDAFARLSIGYWYPDMNYRDQKAAHPYWEYFSTTKGTNPPTNVVYVKRWTPQGLQWLSKLYVKLTYSNAYQKVPLLSMLFSSALPTWILLIFIAWSLYYKKYRYLLPALMAFSLLLTLLLGPVVLYRYIYPLVVLVPIWLGIMLSPESYLNGKKEEK
jgi:ABC-type multidrug transport system fused ATPase/permease subunit